MSDFNDPRTGSYWASKSRQEKTNRAIVLLVLSVGAVTMLAPLLWMLSTSLKTPTQVFAIPPIWVPNPVQWVNYAVAWRISDIFISEGVTFTNYTINTLIITVCGMTGVVLSCSSCASPPSWCPTRSP
jgi:multiple sugar transport system permease protein